MQDGEGIRCGFVFGAQDQWAEDSPHRLTILHEMFLQAASEGWKEVEWYVCRGIWWQMPQLNPEVDISTVQLVQPETSREELLDTFWRSTSCAGYPAPHQENRPF